MRHVQYPGGSVAANLSLGLGFGLDWLFSLSSEKGFLCMMMQIDMHVSIQRCDQEIGQLGSSLTRPFFLIFKALLPR